MNKRCGNCGRYPFCKKTNGATGHCEDWIKRKNAERNITADEFRSIGEK